MKALSLFGFALLLPPALVLGAGQLPPQNLASARAAFLRADADGDGKVSSSEASSAPFDARVEASCFVAADANGDDSLCRGDFTIAFRDGALANGHRIAADLEAEAARIQTLRRAKEAERRCLEARAKGTCSATRPDP